MINIRIGVHETNSSSVHSLVLCKTADFVKWKNGDLLFDSYSEWKEDTEPFVTEDKAKLLDPSFPYDTLKVSDLLYDDDDRRFKSFDEWILDKEWGFHTYVESNQIGEEDITAFGYYGYNG